MFGVGTPLYAPTDPLSPSLDLLARNVDFDTIRCKRLMRQFVEKDSEAFLRNATRLLANQTESRGARYILALLAERGLLLPVLCAPGITREQALEITRAAIRAAPSADELLAGALVDLIEARDYPDQPEQITWAIDILGEIPDAGRVFPFVVRLLRHPNPHIRSKAVLMIGRQTQSAQRTQHRSTDSDPRIRANALEKLWNVNTPEARSLLEQMIRDPNNRVAGNAMLGLYRLGEASVIPEILTLAAHESRLFRATAAWVMGQSGDPRFSEVLAGLLRDPAPLVRKRAFSALAQVRAAAMRAMYSPPCRVAAHFLDAPKGSLRLLLAAAGRSPCAAPDLLPTQILLSEDGQMVSAYRVTERRLPRTISVVFLMPSGGPIERWRDAALACLPWKRPSDLWARNFYQPSAAPGAGTVDGRLVFHSKPERICIEFEREPPRSECQNLWRTLRRLVDVAAGPSTGKQIIVFVGDQPNGAPGEDLVPAIQAAQATVHAVAQRPGAALEDLCRKVGGVFALMEDPEHASEATLQACTHQSARYEIAWPALSPEPSRVKVRVHGPSLWGETTVTVPAGRFR